MRTYVRMVVCIYIPRFELAVAAGEGSALARQTLAGRALAVAPLVGGEQRVGEVSGAAEAHGVPRGMVLGEALARCPDLVLRAGRPRAGGRGVGDGAARAGIDRRGRRAGPSGARLLRERRAARDPRHAGARRSPPPARWRARRGPCASGPGRRASVRWRRRWRCARAVRSCWTAGRPSAGSPDARSSCSASARTRRSLIEPLSRLGVRTLGELTRLGRPALSDRFGAPGALAHRLACGEDSPLRPRRVEERLEESMEVGDASSGEALKRVLGVLVDRLLARSERRGRTLRAATLSARLLAGGGWRERVVFRQALCDPERIWLALSVRLLALPAPAAVLGLAVERFGPPVSEQGALLTRRRCRRPASPAARDACARPSPRCARWPGRTRRCGPCASIPTRACPSGGWCWRRSRSDGSAPWRATLNSPGRARVRWTPPARWHAGRGERRSGRVAARVLAGGGSLVDGRAAATPLLGAGGRAGTQRGRLSRSGLGPLVRPGL